jgi:arsenate reductase (glutaredoxin)
MNQINDLTQFDLVDIKKKNITALELKEISQLSNLSFENLFNRRAQKFKLISKEGLTEDSYFQMIIEEYTFLQRPVIVFQNQVFVGNSKSVVAAAMSLINA